MKTKEYIKADENLKRDEQKGYQRKVKRVQEEHQTLLKEEKKAPRNKRK